MYYGYLICPHISGAVSWNTYCSDIEEVSCTEEKRTDRQTDVRLADG